MRLFLLLSSLTVLIGNARSEGQLNDKHVKYAKLVEKMHPNTTMVILLLRHGQRLPGRFLNGTEHIFSSELGAYELTKIGKVESTKTGEALRGFVGSFVSKDYSQNETEFYSSSASRCEVTLQSLLDGLYSIKPVTSINYTVDDPLLRMYSVNGCKLNEEVYAPIKNNALPELMKLYEKNKLILNYMSHKTGWPASIESAVDLADNLNAMFAHNVSLPNWLEKPELYGHYKKILVEEYLKFNEIHSISCANYEPCRNLMSGYLLHKIIGLLVNATEGVSHPKLVVFVSHTEVILSLMKMIGISKSSLQSSAGILLQFRNEPIPSIRLLNHDPVKKQEHIFYEPNCEVSLSEITDEERWIPLYKFVSRLKQYEVTNWEEYCMKDEPKSNAAQKTNEFLILSPIILLFKRYLL